MKDSASRRRTHRHAGFTLIEMLVAIALLAMLAVLSWRGLDATIRGRDDIVSSVTQTRLLGRYFSQLQYDMLNLVPPNETGGAPLRIRPDELVLVRRLGAGNGASRVQIVRYRLVGHQLQRSASQPLETLSQLADELHHMDDFASVTASDDVRSMKLAVFLAPGGVDVESGGDRRGVRAVSQAVRGQFACVAYGAVAARVALLDHARQNRRLYAHRDAR